MIAGKLDLEAFEMLAIDTGSFDHEGHVYIARELVLRYGQNEAGRRFSDTLRQLTAAAGIPGKYHETITRFYVVAIAERTRDAPDTNWERFKALNPDILDGTLLETSYSPQRLASDEARRYFLLPDRRCPA